MAIRRRIPLLLAVPILWGGLDYLRAHAGFLAFPWATLAHSQHDNLPLLQVASLVGEHGLSACVALGNAVVAETILRFRRTVAGEKSSPDRYAVIYGTSTWHPVAVAACFILLAHLWGSWVLAEASTGPRLHVAAIQPNIQLAERESADRRAQTLTRLLSLTESTAPERPDLIVWPESAVGGNLSAKPELVAALSSLARRLNAPIVVGAAEVLKFSTGERAAFPRVRIFNTAYLIQGTEALGIPYRKRRLVPFSEYVPYQQTIAWPEWIFPRAPVVTPGEGPLLFNLPSGIRVGPLICWESLFDSLARDSVAGGAQVLVQLSNDVWFGISAAPKQHNLASVLRAVENRVPVVIASNSGPSQIIDSHGRIVASHQTLFEPGIVTGDITAGAGPTVYTVLGDGPLLGILAVFALGMITSRTACVPRPQCAWTATTASQQPSREAAPVAGQTQ